MKKFMYLAIGILAIVVTLIILAVVGFTIFGIYVDINY